MRALSFSAIQPAAEFTIRPDMANEIEIPN
jgi:hypothetical protein